MCFFNTIRKKNHSRCCKSYVGGGVEKLGGNGNSEVRDHKKKQQQEMRVAWTRWPCSWSGKDGLGVYFRVKVNRICR